MKRILVFIYVIISIFSCVPKDEKTYDLFYDFQIGMSYEDFYKKVNDNINNESLLLYDYTPPPIITDSDTFPGNTYQELKVKFNSEKNDVKYWEFRPTFFNDDLMILKLSNDSIHDLESAKSFLEDALKLEINEDSGIFQNGGLEVSLRKNENGGVELLLYDKARQDKRTSVAQMNNNSLMTNEFGDSWTEEYFDHFKNKLPMERISNNAW